MKDNKKPSKQNFTEAQKKAIKEAFGDQLVERLDDIQLSEISGGFLTMCYFN